MLANGWIDEKERLKLRDINMRGNVAKHHIFFDGIPTKSRDVDVWYESKWYSGRVHDHMKWKGQLWFHIEACDEVAANCWLYWLRIAAACGQQRSIHAQSM